MRGADKQTFIYYGGWMRSPGPKESLIETLTRQKTKIMNALIIPIRPGEKVKPGDIVLTTWASGTGMQRAIVVSGGTPEAPKVRYLDMDFDSPSGWGKKEDLLKPDTFHRLTKPGEVGTTLACAEGGRHARYILTHEHQDQMLVIGFAGRMKAVAKSECKPLPIAPEAQKRRPSDGRAGRLVRRRQGKKGRSGSRADFRGVRIRQSEEARGCGIHERRTFAVSAERGSSLYGGGFEILPGALSFLGCPCRRQ